MVDIDNIIYWM